MIAEVRRNGNGRELQAWEGQQLPRGTQEVLDQLPREDRQALERWLREPDAFVDHPAFHDPQAETDLERCYEVPESDLAALGAGLYLSDLPRAEDHVAGDFVPLTAAQETRLFVQMNYAGYQISRIIRSADQIPLTSTLVVELLKWHKLHLRLRSRIIQANIPLVLAMAKRVRRSSVDFSDLVSEGCMALVRSVDNFDCARGFRFSTYACRAILKGMTRIIMNASRYHHRFPVEFDPNLEKDYSTELSRDDARTSCADYLRDMIAGEAGDRHTLTENEKHVLRSRFGFENHEQPREPMTLDQVGREMGISKERVRQIQERALKKLREALEEHILKG